jgi:FkbM family methyltransferase
MPTGSDGNRSDVVIRPGTMDTFVFQEMAEDVYRALEYVRPGDVVLDIGANVGAFALHVKSHVPGATVICVEPIPSNCEVLRKNVGNQAVVEALALSGAVGSLTMYDFGDAASACHSIYDVASEGARRVQVPTETLEGLMAKHGLEHVRFLKMDCQGAEFEIVPSTSHETLARIDCIAMEVHPSIWSLKGRIGNIPGSNSKMKRLYLHLIVTHVPVHGSLYHGNVEVWLNRNQVSNEARRKLDRKFRLANFYRPILFPLLRSLKRSAERISDRMGGGKKAKAS